MVLATYKADVVSISGNEMLIQISGTGLPLQGAFLNIGQVQNVCELVIDTWGN